MNTRSVAPLALGIAVGVFESLLRQPRKAERQVDAAIEAMAKRWRKLQD